MNTICLGDNLPILSNMKSDAIDLIYIDPPFNTGKIQQRTRVKTVLDSTNGDRMGFGGKLYRTENIGVSGFNDKFDNFLRFIQPRLIEAYRVLNEGGSLFLHIDYREVHYCKVLLDQIFGRDSFINEIIWAYDYGGRSKTRWPSKHDNILWYAKNPKEYTFRYEDMDRIPYMAPGLVTAKKAARGKTPTDVWWHTIVHTTGEEKTGYPTQKPLGILERIVKVHSNPGDLLLDFFAGSGSFGEAAGKNGRHFVLIDESKEAIRIMKKRLSRFKPIYLDCTSDIKKKQEIKFNKEVIYSSLSS